MHDGNQIRRNLVGRIVGISAVLAFFLFLANCGGGNTRAPGGPQVFQTNTTSQWNGSRITGTVKNLNSAKISFVSVEFDLVDDRSRTLRSVSTQNEKGIAPNGSWDFEIQASAVGAKTTRLRNTITR